MNRFQEAARVPESVLAGLGCQPHHLTQILLIRWDNFLMTIRRIFLHTPILPLPAKKQRAPEVPVEIPYNYVELKTEKRPVLPAFLTSTPHKAANIRLSQTCAILAT